MGGGTGSRRMAHVALSWIVVLGLTRAVIVPPEQCGDPDEESVSAARAAATDWLVANQKTDGSWMYRYDRSRDEDLGGYNITRHAGTLMSLYQQADPALLPVADRALDWAMARLTPAGGGLTLGRGPRAPVGSTALLTAALVLRRDMTGDRAHDPLLEELGSFLHSTVGEDGSVTGSWDTRTDLPVADSASRFFTGEVLWALALLGRTFPEASYTSAARSVMAYVAEARDDKEGWFPPVSDHWAAYGFAELVRAGHQPTPAETAYALRLGGLFSVQVRYESQRTNSTFSWITRGRQTLGAGLGTLGEGLGNLLAIVDDVPELAAEKSALSERAACVAGMLVERQAGDDITTDPRERGAWFQFDVTQIDDQQHALSALLLTSPATAKGVPAS